jgi:hypothetical protein
MRTTLDLDEEILRVAKDLAREREETLGRVVSDLVRLGLRPAERVSSRRGTIPTLPRKPGARPVTAQAVKELLESEE